MDVDKVISLLNAFSGSAATWLSLKDGQFKLEVSKQGETMVQHSTVEAPVVRQNQVVEKAKPVEMMPTAEEAENNHSLIEMKSPIVGTFYSAGGPDMPDYVKVGDKVRKGQILCIVEAMKLMNEIECECDGEIIEICVKNEAVVEYGQCLFKIRE